MVKGVVAAFLALGVASGCDECNDKALALQAVALRELRAVEKNDLYDAGKFDRESRMMKRNAEKTSDEEYERDPRVEKFDTGIESRDDDEEKSMEYNSMHHGKHHMHHGMHGTDKMNSMHHKHEGYNPSSKLSKKYHDDASDDSNSDDLPWEKRESDYSKSAGGYSNMRRMKIMRSMDKDDDDRERKGTVHREEGEYKMGDLHNGYKSDQYYRLRDGLKKSSMRFVDSDDKDYKKSKMLEESKRNKVLEGDSNKKRQDYYEQLNQHMFSHPPVEIYVRGFEAIEENSFKPRSSGSNSGSRSDLYSSQRDSVDRDYSSKRDSLRKSENSSLKDDTSMNKLSNLMGMIMDKLVPMCRQNDRKSDRDSESSSYDSKAYSRNVQKKDRTLKSFDSHNSHTSLKSSNSESHLPSTSSKMVFDGVVADPFTETLICICQQTVRTHNDADTGNVCAERYCREAAIDPESHDCHSDKKESRLHSSHKNSTPFSSMGQLEKCVISNHDECYLSFSNLTDRSVTEAYFKAVSQCFHIHHHNTESEKIIMSSL